MCSDAVTWICILQIEFSIDFWCMFPPLSNLHNFFSKLGAKIDSTFQNKPLFLVHSPLRFTTTVHKAACYVWKDGEKKVFVGKKILSNLIWASP